MPRVTKENARQYLQKALDTFSKTTGESIGATFTWKGKLNIIGAQPFDNFAEKHQKEIWQSLITSFHKPTQPKPELDHEMLALFTKEFTKLNVFTLRRMVGWITQRSIGMLIN